MAGGRPLKYKTVEELQEAIDWYFDPENEDGAYDDVGGAKLYCPTMAGLARSLGLSRQGLLNYANKDQFLDALKEARARVEEALEKRLYGQSVTGVIFNLKNNFGWKDKSEHDVTTGGDKIGAGSDAVLAALKEKHKD